MVQAIVNIGEREDRVLTIVKGKFGFKNKSDAINFVIGTFEKDSLEPELRPEFVRNITKKKNFTNYKTLKSFRKEMEK